MKASNLKKKVNLAVLSSNDLGQIKAGDGKGKNINPFTAYASAGGNAACTGDIVVSW